MTNNDDKVIRSGTTYIGELPGEGWESVRTAFGVVFANKDHKPRILRFDTEQLETLELNTGKSGQTVSYDGF